MPLKNKYLKYLKYDPFIKNDFILPERWCIKFTKENQEILYKWKISKGYNAKPTEWNALNYHGYGIPEAQISDYTEITFDQFKQYVLKDNNEVTKEKVIEKWSVGTYVLFLKNLGDFRAGHIDIINNKFDGSCTFLEKYLSMDISREKEGKVKWFATKSEAEEFAKTLFEPVKHGNGILDAVEPKQSLKQAVHCKTQEEWDFVTKKLGYKWRESKFENYKKNSCIGIQVRTNGHISSFINYYQILSFQEWCDLNGYKMQNEVKYNQEFKVIPDTDEKYEINRCGIIRNISTKKELSTSLSTRGYLKVNLWLNGKNNSPKVHRLLAKTFLENPYNLESINHKDGNKLNNNLDNLEWCTLQENHKHYKNTVGTFNSDLEREEILDIYFNFNKYGEQKQAAIKYGVSEGCISLIKSGVSFKHIIESATPEEINNHLISIGQIPMGIQSSSTSDNTYNHLISQGVKIHEEFFNPTVEFERNYDYTVNPKYKQEFNIINKTKTIKF